MTADPTCVVHVFPPSGLSIDYLRRHAPDLFAFIEQHSASYLFVIITPVGAISPHSAVAISPGAVGGEGGSAGAGGGGAGVENFFNSSTQSQQQKSQTQHHNTGGGIATTSTASSASFCRPVWKVFNNLVLGSQDAIVAGLYF